MSGEISEVNYLVRFLHIKITMYETSFLFPLAPDESVFERHDIIQI